MNGTNKINKSGLTIERKSIDLKKTKSILVESIDFLKKHLRQQGPLEYFVHHNPLHSLENLNFHEAIKAANSLYGASGYMQLNDYQFIYRQGKISPKRLLEEIKGFIQLTGNLWNDGALESALVSCLLSDASSSTMHKHDNNGRIEVLTTCIQKEIFEYDRRTPMFVRHRVEFRSLLEDINVDLDEWITFYLGHILSVYFDAGQSCWQLQYQPTMLKTIISVFGRKGYFSKNWKRSFQQSLLQFSEFDLEEPLDLLLTLLDQLNIDPEHFTDFLFSLCDHQKGWSAFILFAEKYPTLVRGHPLARSSFVEYLLLLVLMEKCLVEYYYEKSGLPVRPSVSKIKLDQSTDKSLRYALHMIENLDIDINMRTTQETELLNEICRIATALARDDKMIWQNAFDGTYGENLINAISGNVRENARAETEPKFVAQIITCLDEREESFRRHIEEVNPQIQTYGFAGNFSLNINYKGMFDIKFRQLGDLSNPPEFIVEEQPIEGKHFNLSHWLIRQFYLFEASLLQRPKDFVFGWLTSLIAGFIVVPHLILKIFFPNLEELLARKLNKTFCHQDRLDLKVKKIKGEQVTVDDMAKKVKSVLLSIGMTEFSDLVFVVGHVSHSLNNPHEAAHDCGACGGGNGFANAKVFSKFANDIEVRSELANQGLVIPVQTKFIAACHNTCSDEFDVDTSVNGLLSDLMDSFTEACKRNAHERCRKFSGVPFNISVDVAKEHVFGRANDLSQPRPEYGHATNAACIIGTRQLTRGLFLDRRAFLCSYDSHIDADFSILKKLLDNVVSVCSGINLEYYFASVDNPNYGSGTKLPHNVVGLQSVINGSDGDLLLGLPTQMIEIHAPIRLQVVVEAPVNVVDEIVCSRHGAFAVLAFNEWIQVHVFDRQENQFYMYCNGQMEHTSLNNEVAKICQSSLEVYRNQRSYLDFCRIGDRASL